MLTACGQASLPGALAPRPNVVQSLRQNTPATTAKTGFPIAMAELNKIDPQAQLYEIDVWHEAAGQNMQYGFLRSDQSGNTFRVQIDIASQQPL